MTGQDAPAEPDRLATFVVDRKHHAASERVLLATGLVDEPEPRIAKIVGAQLDMAGELIPIVGRPTDLVATDELPVVATAAQIGACLRRILTAEQALVVEVDGLAHRLLQTLLAASTLALAGRRVPQLNAVATSKRFHRSDEVEILHRLNERDRVAARPAPEAVVDALLRTDRQRWRAFAMDRAASHPVATGSLDLGVFADDRDEVDSGPCPGNVLVVDPHRRRT